MTDIILCPHCGMAVRIDDPRLRRLTTAQFAIWHTIARRIKEPLGVSEIATLANVSPQLAYYHIRRLKGVGLLRSIPKSAGGCYSLYVAAP